MQKGKWVVVLLGIAFFISSCAAFDDSMAAMKKTFPDGWTNRRRTTTRANRSIRISLKEGRMYKVGDLAEFTKVFSEEDVILFAGITGDGNPVHTSKEFAAKTRFKERIAHGLLTAGTISAAIGMKLPGPGCLYLSQTLEFKAPVFPGDEITARVEIVEVISGKRLRMKTRCFNQDKVMVIDGEAIIVPPRQGGEAVRTIKSNGEEGTV